MNDAEIAAAAFPSMASTATPQTTPSDPSTEAMLARAFPSMAPPVEPDATTTTPDAATPDAATPDAATPDAPAAEPVALATSGIELSIPGGAHGLDPEALGQLDTIASELGLDRDGAQRLVDLHLQTTERLWDSADAAWTATQRSWREQVTKDPDLGGANLDASVKLAREVLDRFGPGLKAELKSMGLGNHPGIFRLLVRVGKELAAAPTARTSTTPAAPPQRDDESTLRAAFPSMYR